MNGKFWLGLLTGMLLLCILCFCCFVITAVIFWNNPSFRTSFDASYCYGLAEGGVSSTEDPLGICN